MIGASFSVCCLTFLMVLTIIYFSKSRLKNVDNKIFTGLLITNVIGIFIDVFGFFSWSLFGTESLINIGISKIYLVYYLTYTFILMLYIYNLSFNLQKAYNKLLTAFCIVTVIVFTLPIELYFENKVGYTQGLSVNFAYLIGGIMIFTMLYCLLKNKKNIKSKQYIPLFVFVVLTLLTVLVQKINPQMTLLLLSNSLVTFIMYFTIENPDLKMLKEVSKIKNLTEKANEEKSSFIYIVSEEVKGFINSLEEENNKLLSSKSLEECKEISKDIKDILEAGNSKFKRTIDISNIDSKELKTINNKYNLKNIIDQIAITTKPKLNDQTEFRLNLSSTLPKELYGDSMKLKQIINTLLDNSIKYTNKGFIELRITNIIKLDVCRLIITVEDSGSGIDLIKQNEILSNHENLTKEEIQNKDNNVLDLKTIRKIINLIGGTLSIDSNEDKGTLVQVTIDQKIATERETKELKKINEYNEILASNKKVALITQNKNTKQTITSISKKLDCECVNFEMTKECLDNVRNNIKYDIIVIDEYMEKIDARTFMKKIKEIENFNDKVFVITNKKDITTKKELLSLGFSAVLINPLNKKEIIDNFK